MRPVINTVWYALVLLAVLCIFSSPASRAPGWLFEAAFVKAIGILSIYLAVKLYSRLGKI